MKNLLFTIVLVILSAIQLSAATAYQSNALTIVENEKTIIINLSELNLNVHHFSITNDEGEIVFSEKVDKYKFGVKYNLSSLPVGTYSIVLKGENMVDTYTTVITQKEVVVKGRVCHVRPSLTILEKEIYLDVDFASKENIYFAIYDLNGELIFDYKDAKRGKIHKKFNLENLEKGNYKVIVSTDYFNSSSNITL